MLISFFVFRILGVSCLAKAEILKRAAKEIEEIERKESEEWAKFWGRKKREIEEEHKKGVENEYRKICARTHVRTKSERGFDAN